MYFFTELQGNIDKLNLVWAEEMNHQISAESMKTRMLRAVQDPPWVPGENDDEIFSQGGYAKQNSAQWNTGKNTLVSGISFMSSGILLS